MGLLSKIEDRPTPKEVYSWRIYFSAAIVSAAALLIGYDSAFIGGTLALNSFTKEFFTGMKTAEINFLKANIVSCYQAGAFFGALVSLHLDKDQLSFHSILKFTLYRSLANMLFRLLIHSAISLEERRVLSYSVSCSLSVLQ